MIMMREIKYKFVGRNRKFADIWITNPLTLNDLMSGKYPSFFALSNRNNETGNCEFIAEILFTGLKDKNGTGQEIYECDIIGVTGKVIGNKYEDYDLLKNKANLLIEGFGTKDWLTTYKEAVDRGCNDPQ